MERRNEMEIDGLQMLSGIAINGLGDTSKLSGIAVCDLWNKKKRLNGSGKCDKCKGTESVRLLKNSRGQFR